jgi:pyruvate/2-oxoglutarate dehydrogenase complex dihydrolipoamide dehydrogenase (E3) component
MVTPIAIKEATIAISNMFDSSNEKIDYSLIPRGIFTDPEVGSVGLTEENAKRKGVKTIAKIFPVAYNSKAEAIRDKRGLIKMVAEAGNGKIVGVHLIAPRGADIMNICALILKNGRTVKELNDTIFVFPTLSEIIRGVAQKILREI